MSGIKWLQKEEHFEWLQKCLACWKISEEFITWSIQTGKYVSSLNKFRDVAEMCSQCIKFEAQRSPFFQQLCQVCAEICDTSVNDMEKHESDNKLIAETLDSCRVFANACREVAKKQMSHRIDSGS